MSANTSYCSEGSQGSQGDTVAQSVLEYIQNTHWSSSFGDSQESPERRDPGEPRSPAVRMRPRLPLKPPNSRSFVLLAAARQAFIADAAVAANQITSEWNGLQTRSPARVRPHASSLPQAGLPHAVLPQAVLPQAVLPQAGLSQAVLPLPQAELPLPQAGLPLPQAGLALFLGPAGLPRARLFLPTPGLRPLAPPGLRPLAAPAPPGLRRPGAGTRALSNHTLLLSTQRPTTPDDPPAAKTVKPLILSKEQEHILNLANYGTSLFYTGSAGTGKLVLLKLIIKSLRMRHEPGTVAVTASTGLAACNIGGTTLHSFAGVGLGELPVQKCLTKVKRNKHAYKRWLKCKVLIIDEVSMIDGHFLNKLNEIAKRVRKSSAPFGGIQLIALGDFYQLPPVVKPTAHEELHGLGPAEVVFAFESAAWSETIQCTLILKEVFRQRGDQEFVDMLNEMRAGKVSPENERKFRYLQRPLAQHDGIEAAELFPTRAEVDYANNQRLYALAGSTHVYHSVDSGTLPAQQRFAILNNSLATNRLFLKRNAQVMCIKNFDETLVNGLLGQVVDFMDRNTYMAYAELKRDPLADATQAEAAVEAKLKAEKRKTKAGDDAAAAATAAAAPPPPPPPTLPLRTSVFDFLDEVPAPDPHSLLFDTFHANRERKVALLTKLHETAHLRKYPLVRFLLPDGFNTREILVEPEEWTTEDEQGTVLARRVQLPLILAWLLSIHKSQGQTLSKVKVDLRRVFERGQAYVALSRATSRRGLQVLNFRPDRVMVHEKVNRFYETLVTAEEQQRGSDAAAPVAIAGKRRKLIDEYMFRY